MIFHKHVHLQGRHCRGCGFIGYLVGIVILSLILGYPLMLLWNWLVVSLLGLAVIGYWEGVGIFLFSRLIFSPFFFRHGMRHHRYNVDWEHQGGWGKWKYYNEYWKTEGKAAFDEYIKKRDAEKEQEKEPEK